MELDIDYIVDEDEGGSMTVATFCKLKRGSVTAWLFCVRVSGMVLTLRLSHVYRRRLLRCCKAPQPPHELPQQQLQPSHLASDRRGSLERRACASRRLVATRTPPLACTREA